MTNALRELDDGSAGSLERVWLVEQIFHTDDRDFPFQVLISAEREDGIPEPFAPLSWEGGDR